MTDIRSLLERTADGVGSGSDAFHELKEARRRRDRRRRVSSAVIGLALTAVVGTILLYSLGTGRQASPRRATATAPSPVLSPTTCPPEEPPGVISCEQALAIAANEAGTPESRGATAVDARLESRTWSPGEGAVQVWVVTYEGSIQGVHGGSGYQGPSCSVGEWSVVIEAVSGEVHSSGGSGVATRCPS